MSRTFVVYKHTNKLNGKIYIGITGQNVRKRWGKCSKAYVPSTSRFGKAIQKYGWDNFTHEIIADNLTREQACQKEVELIAKYQTQDPSKGYNIRAGGELSTYGLHHSEATRKKNSEAQILYRVGQYDLEGRLIKCWSGVFEIERSMGWARSALLNHLRKKPEQPYHGYYWKSFRKELDPPQNVPLYQYPAVEQYDLNGNKIASYRTYHEAEISVGIAESYLWKCINKTAPDVEGFYKCHNFKWKVIKK